MARTLTNLKFKRVALVDRGANFDKATGDGAHIMLFKRDDTAKSAPGLASVHVDSPEWDVQDADDYEKADLSGDSRRALPDSAFAAVWTDAEGKKHRKLPIHDAGHLAAARGRVDGADIPADVKAAARRKIDERTSASTSHKEKRMTFRDLLKKFAGLAAEPDDTKRAAAADALSKAIDDPNTPEHAAATGAHSSGSGPGMHPAHLTALKAQRDNIANMMKEYGDGPHPDGHPVHAMKAMHDDMCKAIAAHESPGNNAGGPINKEARMQPVEVEKAIKAATTELEKRLNEAETLLKSERNTRLDREMVTLLKQFRATPLLLDLADPNNDVAKFRKMQDTDPAGFERTIQLLKATDAQLVGSGAFRNIGVPGAGGGAGSAEAQLLAKADTLIEKSATPMTKEQAFEKVSLDNPKLVWQYRKEQNEAMAAH
jgi:hypothetical protein